MASDGARKDINVMRRQNSVVHGVPKKVPWSEFDRLMAKHEANVRVRTLRTKDRFVALVLMTFVPALTLHAFACCRSEISSVRVGRDRVPPPRPRDRGQTAPGMRQ